MAESIFSLQADGIDDFHVHLRQGKIMEHVTTRLPAGGYRAAYVMPNLKPPITTTDMAVEYHRQLTELCPGVEFWMTLYLTPSLTPEEIKRAKASGVIFGVKSYPRGVTTNSDSGIESYDNYYPVFKAMEEAGLVLNLHGEVPSDCATDTCVLNAEAKFLPHLERLHTDFPKLKIVLEHATTAEAVELVSKLGETVAATLTVHHLDLVVDDWAGQPHNFCKPVAKYPRDRDALRRVVQTGHPRFFLGTDSAPHPKDTKECAIAHAGVYTSAMALTYLVDLFERLQCLDKLHSFACENGRKFYGIEAKSQGGTPSITLVKQDTIVPASYAYDNEAGVQQEIVPFRAKQRVAWSLSEPRQETVVYTA